MMLYPAMKDLLAQVPSRYQLVNVVAHRARQIAAAAEDGGYPLNDKPVTIAVREIAEGKVDLSLPEEQQV
ncbi:DNA-directed RNA polymerase subunit omega [Intestinimonas sp.]|uniref:DNA-directed RNA polymerase subunit omega n=1 Tax=Intestinimonas sp. TaxID=1965293 RepID=UPI0026152053|nr:DNA-directed RNA polymerase subunit omega [Intestinimonas sp.]